MKPPVCLCLLLSSIVTCKAPPVTPATGGDYFQGVVVGNLSTSFPEPSGMARPNEPANHGYLWMEQDSGGPNTFLAVNAATGATAGSWTLQGVTQSDFEDCASARIGGVNYLYMGDIGDNASARSTVVIYRCVEPVITGSDGTIASGNITAITCQYPAGNTPAQKDAECLLADPNDGTLYIITKRIFPAQIYSLPHAATYSGTQTLTYAGKLATDTSTTSLAIGTGSKVFTTAVGLAYPVGMRLRASSDSGAANYMEGDVTSVSGNTLTLNVDTIGGSGTKTDWSISLAISVTPSGNNGCVTGGSISPDRSKVVLCNYGHPYPGPSGRGGTGLFLWSVVPGQTIGQALAGAPRLLTADSGGGLNYPHSNPPSFPQRECVEFGWDGVDLYSIGEYYSTYGTTTNPLVKYTAVKRSVTTLVLQNGLAGYTGCADTMLGSATPTADNSATASLVTDVDYNGTVLTISSIGSFSGGTQIECVCSAATGMTAGNTALLSGCSVAAYNGVWPVDTVSGNNIRLRRAFTSVPGTPGSLSGHTGANGDRQGLVKFSDLSGVPAGSIIVGAKLVLYDNTEGKGWELHRMISSWSAASTWNSLTSGVTCDDAEAAYTPDCVFLPSGFDGYTGFVTHNVPVATVQGWVDGTLPNQGWAVLAYEESTGDGFQWDSSESATQARKPMLIIRYTAP